MDGFNDHAPRTPDEQARSRWERVNQLAMLGRCDEAVQAQRELLDWARGALPAERLLWVMSGDRQALCWVAVGRHEEWLALFRQLLARVPRRSTNRVERLTYLRAAGAVLVRLGRKDEALRVAGMMRDLAEEDPGWARTLWPRIEANVVELNVRQAMGERATLRREAAVLVGLLQEQHRILERGGQPAVDAIRLNELLAYVRAIVEDPST